MGGWHVGDRLVDFVAARDGRMADSVLRENILLPLGCATESAFTIVGEAESCGEFNDIIF